jgi:hypothetical protein
VRAAAPPAIGFGIPPATTAKWSTPCDDPASALDDGQEIGVKTSNDFSDHFQILSSDLFVIRGLPSYRSTCFPAWDAIPPHGDE